MHPLILPSPLTTYINITTSHITAHPTYTHLAHSAHRRTPYAYINTHYTMTQSSYIVPSTGAVKLFGSREVTYEQLVTTPSRGRGSFPVWLSSMLCTHHFHLYSSILQPHGFFLAAPINIGTQGGYPLSPRESFAALTPPFLTTMILL